MKAPRIVSAAAFAGIVLLSGASTMPAQQPPAGAPPAAAGPGRGFMRGAAVPFEYSDNEGWTSLFDGKTLNGWKGDPALWSVKDGSIYIHPSCEHPTGTTYIYWTGGEVADFALKYELKGTQQVNGGMQFRSYLTSDPNASGKYPPRQPRGGAGPGAPGAGRAGVASAQAGRGGRGGRGPACENPGTPPAKSELAPYDLFGPQADFDANNNFSGMFYEQGGRAIISLPGHALLAEKGKVQDLGTIADKATLDSWFHKDDFNQFLIVAKGNTTSIFMNGHLVTVFTDNDPTYFRPSGLIGPEVESTGEYWVRNIYLKKF